MKMDFPKAKALIYVLTFLGYSYSGYGSGLLNNLKDAVLSAEHIFSDIIGNVIKVANKFKDVHDVLGAAVEEDCKFTCPTKGVKITPNRYHTPSSNGCGSLGLQIDPHHLPVGAMTKCCDSHDLCYDVCNSDKEKCDLDFKRCLYKLCDQMDQSTSDVVLTGCKAAAKMLFTGTQTLGCKSYLDAQKAACYCPTNTKKKYHAGGEF